MATNEQIKNQLANRKNNQPAEKAGVKALLNSQAIQSKFKSVLKEKSTGFVSSLITLVSNDAYLSDAQPMSIISGAMQAAQLDLPLEKQFGFAYLVPFNAKENGVWVKKAQFILGYRGYIQLAMRSGQYKGINVGNVYEGQLISWNPLSEELEYDPDAKTSDEVIGYFGRFELLNGFEKTVYWTKEQVERHRIENNKGKDKKALSGVWASNYDAMAQKTVLRNLLSKWGILSIEMQKAILADESDETEQEGDLMKDITPVEIDAEETEEEENAEPLEISKDGGIKAILDANGIETDKGKLDGTEKDV